LRGDGDVDIVGVAALAEATPGTLTFLADRRLAGELERTRASAIVLPPEAPDTPLPSLRAREPYATFVEAVELLYPRRPARPGIHPSAMIAPGSTLGPRAVGGPHVVIGDPVPHDADRVRH